MKKLLLIAGILLSQLSFCGDLDDGIGVESGIRTGNDLTKDLNTKYIIRKAKAGAAVQNGQGGTSDDDTFGSNVGGVNMIGGKTGDIYIIQDIKGDVTNVR